MSMRLMVSGMIPSSPGAFPSQICFFASLISESVNSVSIIPGLEKTCSMSSLCCEVSGVPRRVLKCLYHNCFLSSGEFPFSLPVVVGFLLVIY